MGIFSFLSPRRRGRAVRARFTIRREGRNTWAVLDPVGQPVDYTYFDKTGAEARKEAQRRTVAMNAERTPRGRGARKVSLPIGVHSIGFPKGTSKKKILAWLADHDLPAPMLIIPAKTGQYTWARLRNVSELYNYRTKHWDTSLGKVAVRYAIHKRRKAKKPASRRRGAANER